MASQFVDLNGETVYVAPTTIFIKHPTATVLQDIADILSELANPPLKLGSKFNDVQNVNGKGKGVMYPVAIKTTATPGNPSELYSLTNYFTINFNNFREIKKYTIPEGTIIFHSDVYTGDELLPGEPYLGPMTFADVKRTTAASYGVQRRMFCNFQLPPTLNVDANYAAAVTMYETKEPLNVILLACRSNGSAWKDELHLGGFSDLMKHALTKNNLDGYVTITQVDAGVCLERTGALGMSFHPELVLWHSFEKFRKIGSIDLISQIRLNATRAWTRTLTPQNTGTTDPQSLNSYIQSRCLQHMHRHYYRPIHGQLISDVFTELSHYYNKSHRLDLDNVVAMATLNGGLIDSPYYIWVKKNPAIKQLFEFKIVDNDTTVYTIQNYRTHGSATAPTIDTRTKTVAYTDDDTRIYYSIHSPTFQTPALRKKIPDFIVLP
jgi:hypothetical protein